MKTFLLTALTVGMVLQSQTSFAACFKDCETKKKSNYDYSKVTTNTQTAAPAQTQTNSTTNNTATRRSREGSHDLKRDNNGIMGDVIIGGSNVNINSVGEGATVDNSVNASFVFGGIVQ